ncbi:longevity assurance proteins LAG1/LAC1 [Neolentinus lepideus HHB14362 ss-1]|uniref:Longevity assurance proteins LAG1/LAC1 n=1 Tax=Neolentinus lepideus HHB14362 ss-1 TaxID=1314782 RepID=A0A165T3B0_9AGAM|nr:longevity assurance proteins LAG1/LAC1 [Neolentinus lepideus HHB14362 ss-1]
MSAQNGFKRRARAGSVKETLDTIEMDPSHHLTDALRPQMPVLPATPRRPSWTQAVSEASRDSPSSKGLWPDIKTGRWIVVPSSSLTLLVIFAALYVNWAVLASYVTPKLPNPFEPLLFISHRVPGSSDDDPRYQKGYLDLVFIAYHVIVFSFVRQVITLHLFKPFARYCRIKEAKLDRFGEQGYACVYSVFLGLWGLRIMSQLPTWWYRTEYFWLDYPHWDMKPELKRYYLTQFSYWLHQLIVLALRLEKPRTDYQELVAHHLVTLWLIGWSYLINLTVIGNAVFVSMDIPDVFLALSIMLNYLQSHFKIVSFGGFVLIWTYFRHYLNLVILWSVYSEFDLMPESSKHWEPPQGVWMVWWMKWQIFAPILLLQCLNLFWYYLILRVIVRALKDPAGATDVRSDDEIDGKVESDDDIDD